MRSSTKKGLSLLFLASVFWALDGFSQTTYDDRLVSTNKELNFAFTNKRGIRADNGITYFVEKGGQTLTAYNNGNHVKWTVDVLGSCPKPVVGRPEIRHIKLTTDKIAVTFGKHDFASVDIVDGKVKCLGAD
jgi:hypothetical protein